jgi:hypothetical protein
MEWIVGFFKSLICYDSSPDKLALSFCVGNFIAFSPFLGLHTAMVFVFSWLFKLNLGVVLATSMMINNIWTLVPIYIADYIVGYWLMHRVIGLNVLLTNPSWMNAGWMSSINSFFEQKLNVARPCLWSFLIGGNLLGFFTSILLYPLMVRIFSRLMINAPVG